MARMISIAVVSVFIVGCAETARPPRSAPLQDDLAAWVGSSEAPRATKRVASVSPTVVDDGQRASRYETRRLIPPAEVVPRPRRQGQVNVTFQGADMAQAFQFLAETGRFNLVMAEGLNGKVSATLRGVDPYDALVSLAEANGAKVLFDRQIVVVSKR